MKHNKNVVAFFDPCSVSSRQGWKRNRINKNDCKFHPPLAGPGIFPRSRVHESTLFLSFDEIVNSNPTLPFDSAQSLISSSDMSSLGPLGATAFCIVMIGLLGLSQLMTRPISLNENMSETVEVDDHEIVSTMLEEETDVKDETIIVPMSSYEPISVTDVTEEVEDKVLQEEVVFVEDELQLESKIDDQVESNESPTLESSVATVSTEEILDKKSFVNVETEQSLEIIDNVDEIVDEPEMVMDIAPPEMESNKIDKTKNSIFSKAFARKKEDEQEEIEELNKDPFDDTLRYEMEKLQEEAKLRENETKQKQQAKKQKLREDVESLKTFLRQQESEGVLPQQDESKEELETVLKSKAKDNSLSDNDSVVKKSKTLSKVLQPTTTNEVAVSNLQLNKDTKRKRSIEIFKNKKSILIAAFLIVIGKRLLSLLITKTLS